ncbi:ROK family protein [soil metagenome]
MTWTSHPGELAAIAPSVPVRFARTGETLLHLRQLGRATLTELADTMGVARSTVGERVERLVHSGLVTTVDVPVLGRGRPATTYVFDPSGGRILTAQVGMTGVRLGVSDLVGSLRAHRLVDVAISEGVDVILTRIEQGCVDLMDGLGESRRPIDGIGVGLPGAVELQYVDVAHHAWQRNSIAGRLSATFDAATFVDQDVNLLALGEHSLAPTEAGALLCLKVGSVIGCGTVIDGRIVAGADGLAGEIGHTRVPGADDLCGCGNRGCLSAVAGGAAIVSRLRAAGFAVDHPRDVVRLVEQGTVEAISEVREAGRHIGAVLAAAVNLLNPRTIALWGYLAGAEEVLVAGIRETLYREATPAATRRLRLVTSELGDITGLRGAALMVAERILSPDSVDRRVARTTTV